MNLVSQWLWLGLLTLPAILILHLLRERAQRQPISSLELWRWLEKELRGPRLRRLPITWILLLQLLAALGLNLALTRPQFTPTRLLPEQQNLILVIDTSGSMGALDAMPSRLGQAQTNAAARLAALGKGDHATLIAAGPAAQQLGSAQAGALNDLGGRLAALRPAGDGTDWAGALALAAAALQPDVGNHVVVYTDGAFAASEAFAEVSLAAEVEVHLVGQPQGNQAIVTLAARPSQSGAVQVFARAANFADTPTERTLTLTADGSPRDTLQVALAASGVSEQAWTLPPGTRTVSVSLSGGSDVLPVDDSAALGVSGGGPMAGVLVAADSNAEATRVIERALRSLPNLELSTVSVENYASYTDQDLTVFHGWLPQAWPRGGVIVLAPPEGTGLLNVAAPALAGDQLTAVPASLLADVDLGHVVFGQAAVIDAPSWLTPVLTDEAGLGLLWHGVDGNTRVVVLSFSLADSNLARRAAFPVLMANAVDEVLPPPLPEAVSLGEPVALPPAHRLPFLTLVDPAGSAHPLASNRAGLYTDTFQPGLYKLTGQTLAGSEWNGSFGVNAGSPRESDLRVSALPELTALGEAGGSPASAGNPPWNLWPYVVLLVLFILAVEAAVAWR